MKERNEARDNQSLPFALTGYESHGVHHPTPRSKFFNNYKIERQMILDPEGSKQWLDVSTTTHILSVDAFCYKIK